MKTDQIMYCIVALVLGMLMANMLKNICGCKNVVEGQNDDNSSKVEHISAFQQRNLDMRAAHGEIQMTDNEYLELYGFPRGSTLSVECGTLTDAECTEDRGCRWDSTGYCDSIESEEDEALVEEEEDPDSCTRWQNYDVCQSHTGIGGRRCTWLPVGGCWTSER